MLRRRPIAVGGLMVLSAVGCSRSNSPSGNPPAAASAVRPPGQAPVLASPTECVTRIHDLRVGGRYAELRDFLLPRQASAIIDFLLATDELLAANRELQAVLRERMPTSRVVTWSLDYLGEEQGIFSEAIRVISERIEGPRAWVTIQVADRVPLEVVPLERVDDRWVYAPEGAVGSIPDALRALTQALRRVAAGVGNGSLKEETIEDEFRIRVSPKLKRLAGAASRPAARPEE